MKQRILSLVLALAMLCSVFCIGSVTAFAAGNVWDGTAATAFDGGDGSKEKPYRISTAEQLKLFANIVNGADGQSKNTAACAKLTADIVLNEGALTADADGNPLYKSAAVSDENRPEAWTPIGNETRTYTGIFDGDGHTVSGLYIDNTEKTQGLFGFVGEKGKLQNVGVVNAYVRGTGHIGGVCGYNSGTIRNCSNAGTVTGSGVLGGICGHNSSGAIKDCTNIGTVTGTGTVINTSAIGGICGGNSSGTIKGCTNTGTVAGYGFNVGGVCGGNNSGTIEDCTNTGTAKGTGYDVSGVCGYNNEGTITNCTNAATVTGINVTGGVCGYNRFGMIEGCTNTGTVTGNSVYIGGVCGDNVGSIQNCFNTGTVTGTGKYIGGVCGTSGGTDNYSHGTLQNCCNTGTVTGTGNYIGGVCGNNTASIHNCYYLTGSAQQGVGSNSGTAEAVEKDASAFRSGEVVWLLNGEKYTGDIHWYMKDGMPTLDATGSVIKFENGVYQFVKNYGTALTYTVDPTYTVTIPETVTLGQTVTIKAEDVVVDKGKQVNVKLTAASGESNAFKLTTPEGAELTYTVTKGDASAGAPVAVGDTVLTVNPSTASGGNAVLNFLAPADAAIAYAGHYTGTVTFTVVVEDTK